MTKSSLSIFPAQAPVQQAAFDLHAVLFAALRAAGHTPQTGDVLAVSSKYAAISEGRVVRLDEIEITPRAEALAARYQMNPRIAALVVSHADHVFGGITGFLLTHKDGIVSPNAGIDRSNIPNGYAVLFPRDPYATAARIAAAINEHYGVRVGVILTDSWLMPGRLGTTGVALATAGFMPVQDERGLLDLFGNVMQVTRRGVADTICAAAQLVMGERDEATPFALVRGAEITLTDAPITQADVAIDWHDCIYIQSLTDGLLEESDNE
ncbi:MAG: coenzyme F420-0:L-glutamate ligase [Chloroflexota bacterium]|nr:coenzyme F420-0:L-glutamate ligase [Chloroflexota bacterium]